MEPNQEKPLNKKGLLERWLNRSKESAAPAGIQPRPAGVAVPLSLGQQRLWFLQQLYPGNPFYHYSDAYRLKGPLHFDKLMEAFEMLAERHEILRTTFPMVEGRPIQFINEEVKFDVSEFDLRHLTVSERRAEANELALKDVCRPFDLSRGPLVRITLIRLDDQEHFLLITMHHIITDKWSMEILQDELSKAYQQLKLNNPAKTDPLPIQYADYAYWQRSQATDETQLAYWKTKLAGELPILKLPTDYPRPVRPSFRGGLMERKYDRTLLDRLKSLSRQADTTLFVVLLTAFKILLHRYSRQEDILVGTPFSNRNRVSLERLIGFFNDTLALRSDLSGDPPFLNLVEQVRQTVLEAFGHKNTPFETLVKVLSPGRDLATNPIFQVMFLYHKESDHPSFAPDLSLEYGPFDLGVSKFDLTLYISEGEEDLTAIFEFAKDLFDPATIERMHEHMTLLLEAIVQNPKAPISSLPMLTDAERRQLLVDWNQTQTLLPEVSGIHRLFEEQARRQPDRPAVLFQYQRLTYGELNERADAMAGRLRMTGVGPDTVVGLCADRSPYLIVGIMAILKAGGAYLPLDPEYPLERLHFMVRDAEVPVILVQDHLSDLFAETGIKLYPLGEDVDLQKAPAPASSAETDRGDLAYVIYTSGSTGRPKGVPVTHRNLMYSTTARFDYYIQPPTCFLLLSSFAFDSSVAGIFWTLCSGGKLVLPERRIEQDMDRLADLIAIHEVSHTLLLPSLYALLLQHAPAEKLASLNLVIVAGEACSSSLCRNHFRMLPQVALYNEYGPTEATVWCAVYKVQPKDASGPVPIGRPIANTRIYILDQNHQPIPIGIAGELYVGGAGVAQGYLNRPDLTADRFISNPFSDDPADRLYRTGDLARYRPDGLIEFLGRADHQVKIRGYRIELDEIREALRRIPGVRDAAVIVREEQNPDDETGMEEADHLVELLKTLDPGEADRLLRSIEMLSDDELDYLLAEIKNDNTFLL
jgi:amino acid adenylation domain-containing protein